MTTNIKSIKCQNSAKRITSKEGNLNHFSLMNLENVLTLQNLRLNMKMTSLDLPK